MLFSRMKVVLTRKLADSMDGIEVAAYQVGDVLDLTVSQARLLVAEQWATPERRHHAAPPATERRRTSVHSEGETFGDLERVL
jgi:hypothetical protein